MCDVCGTINQSLTLKDREWTCDNCETTHNRDLLASRNILRQGLNIAAGMVVKSERSCCQ
jgi:putative transposase